MKELAARRETIDKNRRTQSAFIRRRNRALANAPEREDERLTKPSLTPEVRALLEPYKPQGRTHQEFAKAQQNYAHHVAEQSARRKEALHNLYLHARSFILTEQQLNDAVEKTFGSDEDPIVWGALHDQTVWGLGPPATVEKMMRKETDYAAQFSQTETLMQSRLRRIAEVLTSGKIDRQNSQSTS